MSRWPSELEKAGAHMLAVKDMAGLLKPEAAARSSRRCARRPTCRCISTPTTRPAFRRFGAGRGGSGVDAVDAAMDALSGNTSQPCLGSIVEALRGTDRDRPRCRWIRKISFYWEGCAASTRPSRAI
jgi:pyruvate carboxylase